MEAELIEDEHGGNKVVDLALVLRVFARDADHRLIDLRPVHFGDLRDLVTLAVEDADVEDILEVLIIVVTDVGACPLGTEYAVSLFPNAQGVAFDPGNGLYIFY